MWQQQNRQIEKRRRTRPAWSCSSHGPLCTHKNCVEISSNHKKLPLFWDMDLFNVVLEKHGEWKHLEFLWSQIAHLWEYHPEYKRTCYWPQQLFRSALWRQLLCFRSQMSRIIWSIRCRCVSCEPLQQVTDELLLWFRLLCVCVCNPYKLRLCGIHMTYFLGVQDWNSLATICQVGHAKQNASPAPTTTNKRSKIYADLSTVLIYPNLSRTKETCTTT